MTIRQLDLLIVVFDSQKARFFEHRTDGRLHPLNEWQSGLHRFTREAVSDSQGRTFSSVGSDIRHAYEPKHDPHKMEKHDFVHKLVKTLDDAYDQGAFKGLLIVGAERSLGEFHKLASAKLRALVRHEVPKDLIKHPDHELDETLRPYLASDAQPQPARH